MNEKDIVTYRELIKEIRSLETNVVERLKRIEECVDGKVSYKTFIDVKTKTDKMWDDRNRVIGYILGGGIAGGTVSQILGGVVREVMAKL